MEPIDRQVALPERPRPEPARAPALRCAVIVNAGAGGTDGDAPARIRAAFEAAGLDATTWDAGGADLVALARRAAADPAFDLVVAAGGDGTVSAVAGVLAGTGRPLGVLPLGTLNHFAKDLGMPAPLDEAAAAIARAAPRRVDVGEVNGRVFVNNSSIGVYPRIVRERERLRGRVGAWLGKWLAMAWAVIGVLLRLRPLSIRIRWEGGEAPRRTAFVFVGNNRYDTAAFATQRRAALDRGVLGVYVGRVRTRLGLVRLALRAIAGRVDDRHVEALEVDRLTVETRRHALDVAVDGEVVRLRPPIRYRIRPGALLVLAPLATP